LDSALLTTASKSGVMALLSDEGSGGSSWMIFFAIVHAPEPVNGFSPVRNWYRMMPAEKTSVRLSILPPVICSGDM
jgi:hypothetical protein